LNREEFEKRNSAHWREYQDMVESLERGHTPENLQRMPGLFRQVCADLSLSENRSYGLKLSERLNDLVIRGYGYIYRGVGSGVHTALRFFLVGFPNAVRRDAKIFWLCMAMFWVPFGGFLAAASFAPEWVEAMLGPEGMASLEEGYAEGTDIRDHRGKFDSDFLMFAHYIWNNISIDFRTFVGGAFFCLGTIFFLVFNGLHLGAATGYVHMALSKENFYGFVATHSSWELLGMIISGMAGMLIGLALLKPGRRTRIGALAVAGKKSITLLIGAATMTFIAAFFEGFVSVSALTPNTKYTIGIAFWILLGLYFAFCGRGAAVAQESEDSYA